MGLGCGMSMVKYGLFIFNLLCAVAGIALIVSGSIPLMKIDGIRDVLPDENPAIVPILVIVLGSIVFTISFFGCCGAIRESQCMVSTYAVFLFVLVVGQVVIAVFAFLYTSDLATATSTGFTNLWNGMNNGDIKSKEAINTIQRGFECCGLNSPSDWTTPPGLPQSCCPEVIETCTVDNAFANGCSAVLNNLVSSSGMLIAWVSISFGAVLVYKTKYAIVNKMFNSNFSFIQLIGVIFACCLSNSIRNVNRRSTY
ncbi:unnamed protein product [Diamesa tonsa]